MSIYYDEIHRRANSDVWGAYLKEGKVTFEEWKVHWLKTCLEWAVECEKDGLPATAKYIMEIYKDNS